jgi:hypothetical protein
MSTPKPAPHRYVESKTTPGTCVACRLIKKNAVHQDDAPHPAAERQARYESDEHRRVA